MLAMDRARVIRSALVGPAFALASFLDPAAEAEAAPLFSVEVEIGGVDESSDSPITRAGEFYSPIVEGNYYFRTGYASAGQGFVGASTHTSIYYPDMSQVEAGTRINNTSASAGIRLDDLVITGPEAYVDTVLNLRFEGATSANTFARNLDAIGYEATAAGSVTITAIVNGVSFSGTQSRGSAFQVSTGLESSSFEDGILAGFSGTELSLPLFGMPTDTPLVVILSVSVFSQSVVSSSGFSMLPVERIAEGQASFGNTLSFSTSGPVFDLPEGYTASSVSGNIVGNQWVGVPEPSATWLVGYGLLALAGLRTQRRH